MPFPEQQIELEIDMLKWNDADPERQVLQLFSCVWNLSNLCVCVRESAHYIWHENKRGTI